MFLISFTEHTLTFYFVFYVKLSVRYYQSVIIQDILAPITLSYYLTISGTEIDFDQIKVIIIAYAILWQNT